MVKRNVALVRATRTKYFRMPDIRFFKDGKLVDKSIPLDDVVRSDSVALETTN